jgi:MFS family permease
VFSVLTLAIPLAQNVGQFTTLRFLAGLGLGACLPTALAFMSEHASEGRGGTAVTRTMTGYHVGAVLTALLALKLVEPYGWESMFVVGGLLGLAALPLMWAKLPESTTYLEAVKSRERGEAEPALARSAEVVKGQFLWVSIGLWVASFMGLLLVYGLNTWLPTIMGEAGYSIQAGTTLLLVLNVGAVIGLVVAGQISDARGNKPTVLAWFGLAAVFLALLSIKMESELLVYAAVMLTGIFVFSAQVLVYAFVGHLYPPEIRGTALGMSSGVGRVGAIVGPSITGALVTAGIAYPWGFYVFALAAVLAVLALATVPAHVRTTVGATA